MPHGYTSESSSTIAGSAAAVWEALTNPDLAREYFWGAQVATTWEEGSPITFQGEFKGTRYLEKGTILEFTPERTLRYTHWSDLEGIPDVPENYRTWTFQLHGQGDSVRLSVSEENIPTEPQKLRSGEFWREVLTTIKRIVEPT
ncbi:hypothetical protein A0128_07000 [Leptospira tipperaryensis]|uniref:Activator of Hsp90 ATPase homologue 1/2-like C-terminal domain-containing protein n=1 Tax=Leptospira tipperaryensis TaxID=2564040 RepID=A0A1D7UVJ5_9LEPT|nr:hypothetical protein A0128_07000 [Leptospira tipperaryensis]